MNLTTAQLQTLKTDIAADPTLGSLPNTGGAKFDSAAVIILAYNLPASPAFTVWRTDVGTEDVNEAVDWTEVTALTTNNLLAFSVLKDQAKINASLASIRNAFNAIFPVATKPNSNAGLLAVAKRLATRAEKLFATGTGSNASPAVMGAEGSLTIDNVIAAWIS